MSSIAIARRKTVWSLFTARSATTITRAACACRPNRYSIFNWPAKRRSEEHTSELQSLMRISYAVFCLKKKKQHTKKKKYNRSHKRHRRTQTGKNRLAETVRQAK